MNSPKHNKQISIASPALYRAAQWWHWWVDELTGLLPSALRSAMMPNVERLYLLAADDHIIASQGEPAFNNEAEQYPLPPQPLTEEQAQSLRKLVARSREIVLLLPPRKVLVKSQQLPLVAESNLREVLGFEMDRQTPFALDQVYYDQSVTRRDNRNGSIEVELVVTPRSYLDALLNGLQELGVHPHQAALQDRPNAINLVPEKARARKRNSARHLNWALTLIAMTLIATMIALPMLKQAQRIEALEAELQLKMRKAEVVQRIGQDIEELSEGASFLIDKRSDTPLMLEIIDELTRILPDDTWVNNLSVKNGEVQIQGYSTASAMLIPIIDGSDLFQNPRFRASVVTSQTSDDERFHLSMDISKGGGA